MSKVLVCNQKMFLNYDEAYNFKIQLDKLDKNSLIIAPSYTNLCIFKEYNLCAQDVFYEDVATHTGKISSYQLSNLNVKYCLVGHSELRCYDNDELINKKVKKLLDRDIIPILCIGESKEENELEELFGLIKNQINSALKNIVLKDKIIYIAYEPGYLIGSHNTLSKEKIEIVFDFIRKVLHELNIINYKLLYGAAVNKNNIESIMLNSIDGYLIGNSSCDISEITFMLDCIKKGKEK